MWTRFFSLSLENYFAPKLYMQRVKVVLWVFFFRDLGCTSLGDIRRVKFLEIFFECDDAELFEAAHSPSDFEVDVSVGFVS